MRNVLSVDDIMAVLMHVVKEDYKPALDWAMYDSEEECYLEPVFDPFDFVTEELNQYMECESDEVLLEIVNMLRFEDRIAVTEWQTTQEEQDMQQWNDFCKLVKDSQLSAEQIVTECGRDRASDNLKAMKACMDKIYAYLMELHLVTWICPQQEIVRCVTYIKKDFQNVYDIPVIPATLIGTAPPLKTNDNRMSEKGDMMFYGTFEEDVAFREVGVKKGDYVTVGRFHTNKKIRVLDLSDFAYHKPNSIFDAENREKRSQWFFVKSFIEQISGEKDENDKLFYKPTQVFTKYIQRKTDLSGIIYHSAKFKIQYKDGRLYYRKCLVLFVENRDCIEQGDVSDKHRVQLIMDANPQQFIYEEE